jgi:hypothetical protein
MKKAFNSLQEAPPNGNGIGSRRDQGPISCCSDIHVAILPDNPVDSPCQEEVSLTNFHLA